MKRRLLNVMAGVSLMLCVATVALWVRSFWRVHAFATGHWCLESARGEMGLKLFREASNACEYERYDLYSLREFRYFSRV